MGVGAVGSMDPRYFVLNGRTGETSPYYNTSSSGYTTDDFVSSSSGNSIDGYDDGKITAWSKIKSFGKGVVNGVGGAIKGMFTGKDGKFSLGKTLLSAATIAACFIPGVGPVIGGALACKGILSGAKTIINGAVNAAAADTDAEAKAAWEQMGTGTLTTAASALALKGAAGAFKTQISGGSATIAGIKNGTLTSAKAIAKAGLKETGANMSSAASAIRQQAANGVKNVQKGYNYVKQNGVGNTARNLAQQGIQKAQTGINKGLNALDDGIQNYQTPKAKLANNKALADAAKLDGAKVTYYKNGAPKQITHTDGSVINFSKQGNIISEATTSSFGKSGTKVETTGKNGSSVEIRQTNANGDIINAYKKTTGNNGVVDSKALNTKGDVTTATYGKTNTNSGSGYKTTMIHKGNQTFTDTTYTLNNQAYTPSNILEKGFIRLDSTAAGNFINAKLPISDTAAMTAAALDKEIEY